MNNKKTYQFSVGHVYSVFFFGCFWVISGICLLWCWVCRMRILAFFKYFITLLLVWWPTNFNLIEIFFNISKKFEIFFSLHFGSTRKKSGTTMVMMITWLVGTGINQYFFPIGITEFFAVFGFSRIIIIIIIVGWPMEKKDVNDFWHWDLFILDILFLFRWHL